MHSQVLLVMHPSLWCMVSHVWHHCVQPFSVLCSLKVQAAGGECCTECPLMAVMLPKSIPIIIFIHCEQTARMLKIAPGIYHYCSCIVLLSVGDAFISHRIFCRSVQEFSRVATPMYMTSSKPDTCSLDLGSTKPNSPQFLSEYFA